MRVIPSAAARRADSVFASVAAPPTPITPRRGHHGLGAPSFAIGVEPGERDRLLVLEDDDFGVDVDQRRVDRLGQPLVERPDGSPGRGRHVRASLGVETEERLGVLPGLG